MPERYLSPSLKTFPGIAHHTASLLGVEGTIYNRLLRPIMSGVLKPGTKLREDVIGETFGVSRTIVRKVLIIMEQEGIVSLPPNHGAFVASPSVEEAKDVLEATRMIGENVAMKLATPDVLRDDGITRIEAHIDLQSEAENEQDFARARILSGEFQILLAHLAGNKIVAAQSENLITRLFMAEVMYGQIGFVELRANFQLDALRYFVDFDQRSAVSAFHDHYLSIERRLQFETERDDTDLGSILTSQT